MIGDEPVAAISRQTFRTVYATLAKQTDSTYGPAAQQIAALGKAGYFGRGLGG